MKENNDLKFSLNMFLAPLFIVLFMWSVFWLELRLGVSFNTYGIRPRTFMGLQGILFSPFIHGSVGHLYNNTLPIAILTLALCYFYRNKSLHVLLYGTLLSGLLTWVIGRDSYHIGASGVIYMLASFVFFKGVFTKHYRLIALSLATVFIYGSLLWYIFPIEEDISWEGHLSGFLTGLLLAKLLKTTVPKSKKYAWEEDGFDPDEDEFLKHFDADGNFIETPKEESVDIKITYHYKKGPSSEEN